MRGLHLRNFLLSTTSLLLAGPAFANGPILPTGGQYVAGSGVIGQAGATMTVTQTSGRGVINWQGFSIGQGGTVQVNNGAGATLNRVTGGQLSSILGTLKATGSLYLINPQGVVIGSSGVVVTGGDFVVSTHDVLDQHFMAGGSLLFKSDSPGVITNLGQVSSTGGDVILIAREVTNAGTIQAPRGTVGLAGASEALLTEGGRDGQRVFVRAGTGRIENQGLIEAAQAELKAAGGNIYALAGNNGGVVRATGSETRDGRIWLTARSGDVANTGTLAARNADGAGGRVDVRAPGGTVLHSGAIDVRGTGVGKAGGTVVMTGDRIGLLDGSTVDASGLGDGGKVRIGGDWQGGKDAGKNLSSAPLPAARRVTMTAGAHVKADGGVGGGVGNGGSVVLWSSEVTKFAGSISAGAGPGGGDGGAVETSSVGILEASGTVATLAPAGKTGQWLLDPNDITVVSGGVGALAGGLFDAGGGTGTISAATIIAGLASTDVTIQAGSSIIINQAIRYNGARNALLTLTAGGDLTINQAVGYTSTGTLDLWLKISGAVTQAAAGSLTVNGLVLGETIPAGTHPQVTLDNASNSIRTVAGWANSLSLTSATDLTVGTVQAVVGLKVTENLFLTVAAANGKLTIDQPLLRTSPASTFRLTADRMAINAQVDQGQTNSTTAVIAPYTAGRGIILGGTDDASGSLEISAAEYARLGRVTGNQGGSGRNLQIGDANSGAIVIDDVMVNSGIDADVFGTDGTTPNPTYNQTVYSSVKLVSGSTITEIGSGLLRGQYLDLRSNGAITLNGENDFSYLRSAVSNNHDISFTLALTGSTLSIYNAANHWFALNPGAGDANGLDAGTGNLSLIVHTPVGNESAVQLSGRLVASGLELVGPRTVFFMYGNDVNIQTLAAHVGQLALYDNNSLTIGTVGNTVGVTSEGFANHLGRGIDIESAGTVTQTAAINVTNLYFGEGDYVLTNAANHADHIGSYSYQSIATGQTPAITHDLTYVDSGDVTIDPNNLYALWASGSISVSAGSISVLNDGFGYGVTAGGSIRLSATGSLSIADGVHSGDKAYLQTVLNAVVPNDPVPTLPNNLSYGGGVTLISNSSGTGGTISVFGVTVASSGGAITLSGGSNPATGYALGDQSHDGILLQGATLDAGGGDIVLRGKGVNGVNLTNGSQVLTTTGSVTVTGVGMGVTVVAQQGNPDAVSAGIALSYADLGGGTIRNALIQTTTGAISLTGSNDTSVSTNRAFGISVWGGDVKSTGGAITLTGSGGGNVASLGNDGISLNAPDGVTNAILSQGANAGAITLTGTGRGANADGVRLVRNTSVRSAKGAISITGAVSTQSALQGNTNGLSLEGGSQVRNTNGAVTLSGTAHFNPDAPLAANQYTGNGNHGFNLNGYNTRVEASDTVTITGIGGGYGGDGVAGDGGHGWNNNGVQIVEGVVTSPTAIVITGTGGDGENSIGANGNQGVVISNTAAITATGAGTIAITGSGGGSLYAPFNHGVNFDGGAQITSVNGDIRVTGSGHGQFSFGFVERVGGNIPATTVASSGLGNIIINATTFGGLTANTGLIQNIVDGTIFYGSADDTGGAKIHSTIRAHDGSIVINATNLTNNTNSPGNLGGSNGIIMGPSSVIETTGNGSVTVTGIAGGTSYSVSNYGVFSYGTVRALGGGDVTVNGTAGPAGDPSVPITNATANITTLSNFGVYLGNSPEYYGPWGDGTTVTTNGGNLRIVGTNNYTRFVPYVADDGNGVPQLGNFAVYVDSATHINTAGAGTITVEGLGANGSVVLNTPAHTANGITYAGITTQNQAVTVKGSTEVEIKGDINAGSGSVTVQAGTGGAGNLTLSDAAKITVSGAGNIALAAVNGNFVNTATAGDAALALGTGRWLVYSTDPRANTGEMATYGWRRYNATYAGLPPASVPDAGNGFLYSVAPTVAVTVAGTADKVYDGTTTASGRNLTVTGTSGAIHGDTLVTALTAGSATGAFADRDAGAGKTVTYAASLAALTATDTNGKPVYGYGARVTDRASIAAAPLGVTATAASKTYGQVDPTLGYTASGVQAGDTVASVVSGALGRQRGEDVGVYAIGRGTLAANSNYILTFIAGQLSITPAPLVIQADDALRISGIDNPTLGASYSGLVNGDGASVVSGLTVTTAASATSPAGHYAIAPSGASARNYVIRYVNGVMTVTAAPTTFEPPPALGGTATGGTSSATGFQNRSGGVQTASAPASFVAPRGEAPAGGASGASPSTTVSTSSFTAPVGGGSIITVRAPGGGGSEGGSGAPGASTGGQLEASVNAGSFNVIYSQPADYRVSSEPRGGGGSGPGGPGAGAAGSLASSTSFTTFSNEDHPSVSIVNSGEPGSRGGSEGGGPTSGDTNGRQ